MRLAAAESMKDAILFHLERANWPFCFEGKKQSARNEAGDEIFLLRSPELISALQNGYCDVILCGDDIIEERQLLFEELGKPVPRPHILESFAGYGRKFESPNLDLVAHQGTSTIKALNDLIPGAILITEHPYTLRRFLVGRGLKTSFVGRNEEGYGSYSPLTHDDYRAWAIERGLIGIEEVKGRIPALLRMGHGDAGTLVNESLTTLIDNELMVVDAIQSGIETHLIANESAYISERTRGRIELLRENLKNTFPKVRQEFESRQGKER